MNKNRVEILIVDDREENLLALEAALVSPNYHLVRATSGDEALRYLLDHEPALILLDVQMPILDGFETASIIKSSPRTREIPIIFITALNPDDRVIETGYEFGAVDYISKPFSIPILRSKVGVFVDVYRKTQRLIGVERQLRESEAKERELKIAELELRNLKREKIEQKRYRDLVEGIEHGVVWSAVPETKAFSYVSPVAERLFGYPQKQWFEELNFWDRRIRPEDKIAFDRAIRDLYKGKQVDSIEHCFQKADGTYAWLHTSIRLAQKTDSPALEIRGLSIDISKNKEAERKLARNKLASDFLAQASYILSESFDLEKALIYFGQLIVEKLVDACHIEIVNEDRIVRQVFFERNDKREKVFVKKDSALVVKESKVHRTVSESFTEQLKIEKKKYSSMISAPLQVRGTSCGAVVLFSKSDFDQDDLNLTNDIATRISTAFDNAMLYNRAQKAISLRDEFLSIASHELKTPLTPMKLQVQNLQRQLQIKPELVLNPERLTKTLISFGRQIDRLAKLIEGLLDVSRINIGKLSLNYEEFDLRALIEEVISRFQEQLATAGSEIQIDAPKRVPVVLDSFRIEQVIVNLLTNAIKFAPAKPIRISIKENENNLVLKVIDQGIGIAEEDLDRIFKRFERAASASHFGGLGLGLYISQQIIEAHRGKISVQSKSGSGSTFTIEIPTNIERNKLTADPSMCDPATVAVDSVVNA